MQRKYVVIIIVGVIIISGTALALVFAPNSMSQVGPTEMWNNQYITNLRWDGYRHFYATNQSHLFIYDYYDMNMTTVVQIPGTAINSVHDIVARPYASTLVLSNDDIIYTLEQSDESIREAYFPGLNSSIDSELIETDNQGNRLFIGTVSFGIYIYEFEAGNWSWLTTTEGLHSNHIENICVEGDFMFVESGGGLQMFDISTKALYNLTNDYDFDIRLIQYSDEYNELFLGTDGGVHIYRLFDESLEYIRSLGPSDGLQSASITCLDVDLTSHKLLISTGKGICTFDLHTSELVQLQNTEDNSFGVTLDLLHFYSGSKCNIVFATSQRGVWLERLDYSAPEPFDTLPIIQNIIGVLLGIIATLITMEYSWFREERKEKVDSERRRKQCLREIRTSIIESLQYLHQWRIPAQPDIKNAQEELRKKIHAKLIKHSEKCGRLVPNLEEFTDKLRHADSTVIGKEDPRITDAINILQEIETTLSTI